MEKDIYDYLIPYLYIDLNLALGKINFVIPQLKRLLEISEEKFELATKKIKILTKQITDLGGNLMDEN